LNDGFGEFRLSLLPGWSAGILFGGIPNRNWLIYCSYIPRWRSDLHPEKREKIDPLCRSWQTVSSTHQEIVFQSPQGQRFGTIWFLFGPPCEYLPGAVEVGEALFPGSADG